jgi:predicted MFS family arabinose efflux permease
LSRVREFGASGGQTDRKGAIINISGTMDGLLPRATSSLRHVYRRHDPGIWVLTVVHFFVSIGFSICIPFLCLYFYQERGLSMTMAGTIILAGGLCSALSQALGGVLSDRFGRRPILLLSASVSILLYTGLAFSVGLSAPVWTIAVVYIVSRAMLTIARPVISAMVVDYSSKERLTEAYGILRTGANIGWAAGPAIGGYLLGLLSYGWLFGIAALTCGIASLIAFLRVRESPHVARERLSVRSMLPAGDDPSFLVFLGISLVLFIAVGQMGSTLSIYSVDIVHFSTTQFGLLLTLNGLIVVFFQYPVTLGLGRVAKFRALILGSLLYGLGYLSLGWITQFGWALGAMAIVTAGEMVFSPVALSVIGELSPENQRGRYMGLFGLSQTIGIAMGPLIGGVLIDAFSPDARLVWAPIGLVALIAAIGYYWWDRRFGLQSYRRYSVGD